MAKLLFINACVRGEESRTLALARTFLAEYRAAHPEDEITERNLMEERIQPLYPEVKAEKDALWAAGRLDAPMFAPARQFAQADKIVIAAPLWDMAYPAILRIYTEAISVINILFRYTESGQCVGMAKADKLLFISTRGSDFSTPEMVGMECGAYHLKALCAMYGIPQFESIVAQGLDDIRNDAQALLGAAHHQAKALAKTF